MLGGVFITFLSYSSMFHITSLTTFVYLMLAIFMLREVKPASIKEKLGLRDIGMIVKDTPFFIYCIIAIFMQIPYQQMYTLLSVYSSSYVGLDKFWIGMLYAESGLMVVLFQYWISRKIRSLRMTHALAFCALVFAFGFGMLGVFSFLALPFMCIAIVTLAEMIWAPAGSTLQANLSPEARRGRYFGFSSLCVSTGIAMGPYFGGVLKDSFSNNVQDIWYVIMGMFLLCCILYLALGKILPERANTMETGKREPETVKKIKKVA